jgi:hypothetical protein
MVLADCWLLKLVQVGYPLYTAHVVNVSGVRKCLRTVAVNRAYCSLSGQYMNMESHNGMILTGEN